MRTWDFRVPDPDDRQPATGGYVLTRDDEQIEVIPDPTDPRVALIIRSRYKGVWTTWLAPFVPAVDPRDHRRFDWVWRHYLNSRSPA